MKKIISCCCFLLLFYGCSSSKKIISNESFIKVQGIHFINNGKPYYYLGTNFWYGCYLGASDSTGNRKRLILELDKLKSLHIDNLRILGGSLLSDYEHALNPAILIAPGKYNESLLDGLDYLLDEMGKRNMRAVIFLNDFWEWEGGMTQYNLWTDKGKNVDRTEFKKNRKLFYNYSASFYRNKEANKYYRELIKTIVTRKNKYNGLYYFEDPTIMSWELANELKPGKGEDALKYIDSFYRWIDQTAAFIHSIDQNHLVTTGSEGIRGSLGSKDIYVRANKTPYIDYLTFHLWVKNWGWFDPMNPQETYTHSEELAVHYINEHIQIAKELNKPIVLEEFGITRDNQNYLRGTPTTIRDKYFLKIYDIIYDNIKMHSPLAGSNFWAWGGSAFKNHDDAVWRKGDPLMGDPPHEPQGLYSIFDTDYNTMEIIREHGEKIMSQMSK